MGTTIQAVATARPRRRGDGVLQLADRAVAECLARAGRTAADVDVLVHAGIYHERSQGEPALASLIQQDVGANPHLEPADGHRGTFSFDVSNGACGVVTAVHVIDGFLHSGAVRLGMVVASDAPPPHALGADFPARAAAVLLARTPGRAGFDAFAFETHPEDASLYTAEVSWEKRGRRAGNVLTIEERPPYADRAAELTVDAAGRFCDRHGFDVRDVDLVVASGPSPAFARALCSGLGYTGEVATPQGPDARTHSAGLLFGVEAVLTDGRLARAGTALFASAGSGVTVALALYRS